MSDEYETETAIRAAAVEVFEAMGRNDWAAVSEAQCAALHGDAPVDEGLANRMSALTVDGVDITERTDTTASVDVDFHYTGETEQRTETVPVILEDGEWKAC